LPSRLLGRETVSFPAAAAIRAEADLMLSDVLCANSLKCFSRIDYYAR
jgi:hypothetical protein